MPLRQPKVIWVGGPQDGSEKEVPQSVIDNGYLERTEINRAQGLTDTYRYPVRKVKFNAFYVTQYRIYYNERVPI